MARFEHFDTSDLRIDVGYVVALLGKIYLFIAPLFEARRDSISQSGIDNIHLMAVCINGRSS